MWGHRELRLPQGGFLHASPRLSCVKWKRKVSKVKTGGLAALVAGCERSNGDFPPHVGAKMSVPCWEQVVAHTLFRNKASWPLSQLLLLLTQITLPQSGASSHTLNTPLSFFFFFFIFSIEKVSKITSPVLIIHGTDDEVIDFSHGLALFERCPKAVEPLWVEGAGHNDIELYSQYLERLRRFIGQEVAAHHAWAGSSPSQGDGCSSQTLLDFPCTGGKHWDEGLESDPGLAAPVCLFPSTVV